MLTWQVGVGAAVLGDGAGLAADLLGALRPRHLHRRHRPQVRADQLLQGRGRHQDDGVLPRPPHPQQGPHQLPAGPRLLCRQGGGPLHPPGGRWAGGRQLAPGGGCGPDGGDADLDPTGELETKVN